MGSAVSTISKSGTHEAANVAEEQPRSREWDYIYGSIDSEPRSERSLLVRSSLEVLLDLRTDLRHSTGFEQHQAVECLSVLSSCKENLGALGSSGLGLLPDVVANMSKIEGCTTIIANVAVLPQNHQYLLSAEVGLMELIVTKLQDCDAFCSSDFVWILTNISDNLGAESIDLFLSYNPLPYIARRLLSTPYNELLSGVDLWILCFLESISCHPRAAAQLRDLKVAPCLMELMTFPANVGVKVSITVFNILGKVEATSEVPSVLQTHPAMLDRLLMVFKAMMTPACEEEAEKCKKTVQDYYFGALQLRCVCNALWSLSISDTNKKMLVKAGVLEPLFQTLRMFATNSPGLTAGSQKAGGGGEDIGSAELVMETLLQLSFSFRTDSSLLKAYSKAAGGHDLKSFLSECCSVTSKLSPSGKSCARSLLTRIPLTDEEALTEGIVSPSLTPTGCAKNGQVVLSYCPKDANLALIEGMRHRLAELGQDVSHGGSGLESTHEWILKSIESAHTVIVFVSPQYRESALCRIAATCILQRQRLNPSFKVVCVKTTPNFQLSTDPFQVEWMTPLVNTTQRFPLWRTDMINPTSRCVHEFLSVSKKDTTVELVRSSSTVSGTTAPLSRVPSGHSGGVLS